MNNQEITPKAKKFNVERLVVSAVLIALGTVLSLFQPFQLPMGGGITILSMLPVVLIAYRYGIVWGLGSSVIYSVLQMFTGFNTVSAFFLPGDNQQVLWKALLICFIDYVLAYSVLCLGGLFRKSGKPATALCLGGIVGLGARYLCHILSGAVFFGSWAEWWFTDVMGGEFGAAVLEQYSGFALSLFYSVIYNGLYMIPEIILTAVGAVIVGKIPAVYGKHMD
jgi:thiamine transporter